MSCYCLLIDWCHCKHRSSSILFSTKHKNIIFSHMLMVWNFPLRVYACYIHISVQHFIQQFIISMYRCGQIYWHPLHFTIECNVVEYSVFSFQWNGYFYPVSTCNLPQVKNYTVNKNLLPSTKWIGILNTFVHAIWLCSEQS